MARVTLKSQAIIIDQLTAQIDELRTQVGVLMSALEESNQRAKSLQDEIDDANSELFTRDEVEQLIEIAIVDHQADMAIAAPKSSVKPMAAPAVVESAPTIEVSDFDRAMYRKFQALDREQRLAIISFARPTFGHVGIHNIVDVRAAWHEYRQQQSA